MRRKILKKLMAMRLRNALVIPIVILSVLLFFSAGKDWFMLTLHYGEQQAQWSVHRHQMGEYDIQEMYLVKADRFGNQIEGEEQYIGTTRVRSRQQQNTLHWGFEGLRQVHIEAIPKKVVMKNRSVGGMFSIGLPETLEMFISRTDKTHFIVHTTGVEQLENFWFPIDPKWNANDFTIQLGLRFGIQGIYEKTVASVESQNNGITKQVVTAKKILVVNVLFLLLVLCLIVRFSLTLDDLYRLRYRSWFVSRWKLVQYQIYLPKNKEAKVKENFTMAYYNLLSGQYQVNVKFNVLLKILDKRQDGTFILTRPRTWFSKGLDYQKFDKDVANYAYVRRGKQRYSTLPQVKKTKLIQNFWVVIKLSPSKFQLLLDNLREVEFTTVSEVLKYKNTTTSSSVKTKFVTTQV